MPKFRVTVAIQRTESIEVEVDASDEDTAKELAVDKALLGDGTSLGTETDAHSILEIVGE